MKQIIALAAIKNNLGIRSKELGFQILNLKFLILIGLTQKYPSLRGRFAQSNPPEIFCEIASPQSGLAMTLVRKSYLNFSLAFCLLTSYTALGQNNDLVLDGAYIVLDGGTPATNIYMVVEQSNPVGIVRQSGGHIHSEGQYNFVKWNSGTGIGNYVFPFGVGGNAADYIPFTFNKTAGSSNIGISTWNSNPQNVPWATISNVGAVTNMNITGTIDLSVPSVIDRWWDIQSPSATADLTFSYRGTENTTVAPTDTFKAQHWNGAAWDPQAGPGNPGVITGIGTVGPIVGQTTFSPWILTRAALSATITTTQNLVCNSQCTGTAAVASFGGTAPYSFLWNPSGQITQTATGLCAGTYSIIVTDGAGSTAIDTVTITQPALLTAAATATSTTITLGENTQLTATGGGTYSWIPTTGLSCDTCATTTATATATTTYCVFVTNGSGCTDSACITINVKEIPCGALFLPNAFTPNGDKDNEQLCIFYEGNCIKEIRLIIYNRWGEKMFETTDISQCWDGTYKGELLNTAVFVYYLKAILTGNNPMDKLEKKGNVSLIR